MRLRGFLLALAFIALADNAGATDLKQGVEQLAQQLAATIPQGRKLRVAITDFPDLQGVTSDLGRYIPERLTTRLSGQDQTFQVIERRRLAHILDELKFSTSDLLVDQSKAKQFGKLVGVEAIVAGTLSDLGQSVDVDARIIEIDTGKVFPGVAVGITKDSSVQQMMERGREKPAALASDTGSVRTGRITMGTAKYVEFPEFRVDVDSLKLLKNGEIEIALKYFNRTRSSILVTISTDKIGSCGDTTLTDNYGNDYECKATTGIKAVHPASLGGILILGLGSAGSALSLPPEGAVTASFRFSPPRQLEKRGEFYFLTSGHSIWRPVEVGDPRHIAKYSVFLQNIEPRL